MTEADDQGDLFAEKPATKCDHEFIDVLNRRWCVRGYCDGGCGGFWTRRAPTSIWVRQW